MVGIRTEAGTAKAKDPIIPHQPKTTLPLSSTGYLQLGLSPGHQVQMSKSPLGLPHPAKLLHWPTCSSLGLPHSNFDVSHYALHPLLAPAPKLGTYLDSFSQSTTNSPANFVGSVFKIYTQNICSGLESPPKSTSIWKHP